MPIVDPRIPSVSDSKNLVNSTNYGVNCEACSKAGFETFKARIEEIARDRINSGQLGYTAGDMVHKELMQEVSRFPVVERFASEVPMISDSAFKDGIRNSVQRILREDRGQKDPAPPTSLPVPPTPSQPDPSAKDEKDSTNSAALPSEEAANKPVPRASSSEVPHNEKEALPTADQDTVMSS